MLPASVEAHIVECESTKFIDLTLAPAFSPSGAAPIPRGQFFSAFERKPGRLASFQDIREIRHNSGREGLRGPMLRAEMQI